MTEPTTEDMARDLEADLARMADDPFLRVNVWERASPNCLHGVPHPCIEGWPAAIRRALAAEAELVRLKDAERLALLAPPVVRVPVGVATP
jgi:hypothetical protein